VTVHPLKAMRRLLPTLLAAGALSTATVAGCAARGTHDPGLATFGDAGAFGLDDGSPSPTISCTGIKSIGVTPASTALSLAYGSASAQQPLKATATYSDGSQKDVTSGLAWDVGPGNLASASDGKFTSANAGKFTVTASCGSVSGTATVLVKLTGTVVGQGVTASDLDGMPGGSAPTIAYPLDGALFPLGLAPLEFQLVPGSATQTVGRVAFEGDLIDLKVYEPCVPIAQPAIAGACTLTLPGDLEADLAGVSEAAALTETVRLAAPGGGALAESASIAARWSTSQLSGGLYFWSAQPPSEGGKNLLMRYDLDHPGTAPLQYYTDTDTANLEQQTQYYQPCFGCHSISQDGTKIAITYGGSSQSLFALLDVATKKALTSGTQASLRISNGDAPGFMASTGFATQTTFSPDGSSMIQQFRGQLLPRAADSSLASQGPALFNSTLQPLGEMATEPFWSPKGDLLAFVSWVPNPSGYSYDTGDLNGDEIVGAQLWMATASGTSCSSGASCFGTPKLLVARGTGVTEHHPAISDDDALVAFNESSCSGPPTPSVDNYGAGPCDGYDDPSAKLRLVPAAGGAPVDLAHANGTDTWTNSWPRFSPSHGTFQGKTLYWVAFSSRRPYGATLAGSNTGNSTPQLWFAGVAVDSSGALSGDPSFAPVWMPAQNATSTPRGNHIPQWVTKAVPVLQ
jgi:hypothetical protein